MALSGSYTAKLMLVVGFYCLFVCVFVNQDQDLNRHWISNWTILHLNFSVSVSEPAIPRITSDTGTIDALDKRQAVSGSIGLTVQTFTATSLTLKCYTEGSPKPTVSWSKNGQALESKGRISISNDGSMTIKNTRMEDTGRYKCSAKNVIGETSAASSVFIRGNYHF